MSEEQLLEDLPTEDPDKNGGKWSMPEPIFRSSEGHTPKQGKSDDDADTLETETGENEADGPHDDGPAAVAADVPANAPAPGKSGGCFRSFLFILGMISLLAAVIVAGLIYFLTSLAAPETGNF